MKRKLAIILSLAAMLAMTACGGTETAPTAQQGGENAAEETTA